MSRKTIVLDDKLDKKLHQIQARLIKESDKSISFSKVIILLIREGLKNESKIKIN